MDSNQITLRLQTLVTLINGAVSARASAKDAPAREMAQWFVHKYMDERADLLGIPRDPR